MKRFNICVKLLSLFALLTVALSAKAQQEGEEPIITIYSSAYTELGETNQTSILLGAKETAYYDIDFGSGANEVEVGLASVDSETGEFTGTSIPCRVQKSGIIKIYGDPKNLDVIVIDGAYVNKIEMEQCTELQVISLRYNQLQELDLTPFTKAVAIYLTGNPFTAATPLIVGAPKPSLTILEIDIIDHLDQNFNLSDYPALQAFDGYHNLGLNKIDPTGCPILKALSVELTNVESIDVTKNPQLINLNISETRVKNVDLSQNPYLQNFLAEHVSGTINTDVKLEGVDVTNNPNLVILSLSGNDLTSVDLTKNSYITNLKLRNNKLQSVNLDNCTQLYSVDLTFNDMDFATLPLPKNTWGEYFYDQNALKVDRSVAVNTPIDLSSRVLRDGTTTTATVFRKVYDDEPEVLDASLYTYADGRITFHQAMADSVYVQFSNDAFTDYQLRTTPFMVKSAENYGKPSRIVGLTLATPVKGNISLAVGLQGATAANPKTFYVDFGDGVQKEFTTTHSGAATAANVNVAAPANFYGNVDIYVKENDIMTSLEVENLQLYNANVVSATELQRLKLKNCGLSSINLAYNRCLTDIDLSYNQMYELDLTGVYGNYEKNVLTSLNVAHNQLESLTIIASRILSKFDASYNNFTGYSLKDYDNIDYFDMSHNKLEGELSLAYLANASYIDVSYNSLSSLLVEGFSRMEHFDVSHNAFTIATLPLPTEIGNGYTYAPQAEIELQENAPAINLSEQNRVVNGKGTVFEWFKADGTPLVEGVDVELKNGGARFLNTNLGKVYCKLTNPALPQLTGQNALYTTQVNVVGAPTKVVATFTTTEDSDKGQVIFTGSKKTALYIDWRGDGMEFIPYPVETSYISYPEQRTYAGANVKVYTYDSAEDITVVAFTDMKMSQIDLTPLTNTISIAVNGAGLTADQIKLPEAPELFELYLIDNALTSYPYAGKYPKLAYLYLTGNQLTEFNAAGDPQLEYLILGKNQITTTSFNNAKLWTLDLSSNNLQDVTLAGLPALKQLIISNNQLSTIDLSQVKNTLLVLDIANNKFTYATLPLPSDYSFNVYHYTGQAPLQAECINGVVDLSAVATVAGNDTQYNWFLGEAIYDAEQGGYLGELLIEGEEYSVQGGKTEFHYTFDDKVMCVLSNATFPSLVMTTNLITVDAAGLNNITIDEGADSKVDVYNLVGTRIKTAVSRHEATQGLQPGIYIVGNRKVLVK